MKCTKFDFDWGSALHPAGGAYSALRSRSCISGVLFLRGGKGGKGKGEGRDGEQERMRGGRGREEKRLKPPNDLLK